MISLSYIFFYFTLSGLVSQPFDILIAQAEVVPSIDHLLSVAEIQV